jgi:GH25 family lysozyme M1 (1,4-beta-N-acetylmuramidase)
MKRIIDISYYQDPSRIDYDVLLDQVDGVIIRCGYGVRKDTAFETHYAEIKARNKPVGTYHFMVEYKPVDEQLAVVKQALDGKEFELGFWPDVELEGGAIPLTKATVTEYIDKMDAYLFKGIAGIYTGAWCWNPIMGTNNPYSHKRLWVASYSSSPYLPHGWDKWFMWQYSSSGRLDGYASNLDMNNVSDANWESWVGDIEPPSLGDPLFKAKVLAYALNVRSTPVYYADNRNVVGQIYEGEIKDVYAVNEANGW